MSDDPLRDPRFPDRPQHPDYWRLSEIVLDHDARTIEIRSEEEFEAILGEVIDPNSLGYMAAHRAGTLVQKVGPDALSAGAAGIVDGFLLGVKFAQRGGHREP